MSVARIPHPALENPRRWQAIRQAVFKRDGHRCQSCGKAGRLECDHRIPIVRGGEWWAVENCQALCRGCHISKTRIERIKPNAERDEWRKIARDVLQMRPLAGET